ncbi:Triacylglycerol lipase OBL1 [Linum grandiflorum]
MKAACSEMIMAGTRNSTSNGSLISSSTSTTRRRYVIVRPEKGGVIDLIRYAIWDEDVVSSKFLEMSSRQRMDEDELVDADADYGEYYEYNTSPPSMSSSPSWVILVSIVVRKIISSVAKPMEYCGYVFEFLLNLLSLNGSLFGLLLNFLFGKVVIPERGSETFISTIGHLDGRIDLFNGAAAVRDQDFTFESNPEPLMDLCIMASKLAYENAKVVHSVVSLHWKMHFVGFFNCWNDFEKQMSTQVYILTDKPKDAKLILISFRGTEPFDADDWCTDFDYSWYEVPNFGKLHMGFVEALGLGNRNDISTFDSHLIINNVNQQTGLQQEKHRRESAYYLVREKLKSLLAENKDAKFVVTGHSLGGALAILFPTVLVLHQEGEIMKRLLGVYTFGQPRIGNAQLGKVMEARLEHPSPKYFRVVYCNDLVPRLPYDDKTFLYKHFGWCLYYDSSYIEQEMQEEPNKNFFSLRTAVAVHLNAVWELVRSFFIGYTDGPEYKEGWLSVFMRIIGVALPGISAHSPTDYVNSVRLGRRQRLVAAHRY